jgi:hypothetical protein
MQSVLSRRLVLSAVTLASVLAAACGGGDTPYTTPKEELYDGGKKPQLPTPPPTAPTPIKTSDGYTVYGASHYLRSFDPATGAPIHNKDVTANPITIVGYIVDTNVPRAPKGCQHPQGQGDKDCADVNTCCPKTAEVPTFSIADSKGDTTGQRIRVVRWARNYAVIFDAMDAYSKLKPGDKPDKPIHDEVYDVDLPFPLPAVGAKVKITGTYGVSTHRLANSQVADPVNGVMEMDKIEFVEQAPAPLSFSK